MFYKFIFLTIILFNFSLSDPVVEVSNEAKGTKRVFDIKAFVTCLKEKGEIQNGKDLEKVLEHKKGYKKQIQYLKKVYSINKETALCSKESRKVVPELLDDEQFAYPANDDKHNEEIL